MEGLTSTYEVVALLRAGIATPQRFLEIWAERITQLLRTPGRLRTSLSQASFDAWIKHYRPDESTANTTVSYYLKGSIVGFLLDLELRRRSGGAKSLDDLVRSLFEKHGRPPGLPEDGVEKVAIELIADRSMHECSSPPPRATRSPSFRTPGPRRSSWRRGRSGLARAGRDCAPPSPRVNTRRAGDGDLPQHPGRVDPRRRAHGIRAVHRLRLALPVLRYRVRVLRRPADVPGGDPRGGGEVPG